MKNWVWLDERDARAIHDRALIVHGGATGVRDSGLLQSALARPQNLAVYDEAADIAALAASYTAGVVKNDPFTDGNKRTGFILGIVFLELNGSSFAASEEDAAASVLALADGTWDETNYAEFLRDNIAGA